MTSKNIWDAETLRELLDYLRQYGPQTIMSAGQIRRYVFDGNGSFAKIETACLAAGDVFTAASVERLFAKVALSNGRTLPDMLDLNLDAAAAALDAEREATEREATEHKSPATHKSRKTPHNKGKQTERTKMLNKAFDDGMTNEQIQEEMPSVTATQVRTARTRFNQTKRSKG